MDGEIRLPELPELTFNEATHTYRLNGSVIPSVTQLMKPLSELKYGAVPEMTLKQAANKGTIVHAGIETWLAYGIDDVPPELSGYYNAFKEWWNLRKPVLIASEAKIYHKLLQYAGTLDLIVLLDGVLTLVDVKTTYNLEKQMCGIQLEGYNQALASHGIQIQGKRILHLKKDGTWSDPEFPVKDVDSLDKLMTLSKFNKMLNGGKE